MEQFNFLNEQAKTNYLKRWSMLNVKIQLVEHSIKQSTSETNEIILRKYLNELLNHKLEEKQLLTK